MLSFFKKLKDWGIDETTDLEEVRSIRLLTYICFISSSTAIFYSIIFLFLGELIPAALDIILTLLFLPSLILNKFKKHKLAKALMIINVNLAVFFLIVVYGVKGQNNLFFITTSMFGISFYKNKLNGFLSFLTAILFYIISELYHHHFEPLYGINEDILYPLNFIGIISISLIVYLLGYHTKNESKVYENKIVEYNSILEQKRKYAIDSLKYAANIQNAIMGRKTKILSNFEDGFILFRPKDIVSGDFYWFGESNGIKIIAAADCTGHGVPAALMTIMGNNFLNQIVSEKEITSPDLILKALNKKILKQLKNEDNKDLNDGMDIAILSIDEKAQKILFAGAMSSVLQVSQGQTRAIRGTNLPIGSLQYGMEKYYEKEEIPYRKGDLFYLFSDGFQDQFGGPKGKKFMKKNLRELIFKNAHLSLATQEKELKKVLLDWQQDEEQTDDILIIGIQL